MASLQFQARRAAIKRKIASDKLAAAKDSAYLQYINDNLKVSRKRPTGWTSTGEAERDFTGSDRLNAMAQARQQIEETPLGMAILQRHLDHVIGPEYTLSMRTDDSVWNAEVEDWWNDEKDLLDIRGMRSWGGLNRCWQGRRLVDGDVGIVLVADQFDGRPRDFVQTIEADRIFKGKDTTDDGIDQDPAGMPLRFHVNKRDPKDGTQAQIYEREDFVFFPYQPNERAEMKRGVSAFLQLLNLLKDYGQTFDAMCQKVKNAAFIGLLFKQDPSPAGGFGFGETKKEDETGTNRAHVAMVPGMNLHPSANEDVKVLESATPNPEFVPFLRWQIRMMGVTIGIPLEYLFADPSETNYAGLMALAQMFRKSIRTHQHEVKRIDRRIFNWKLARAIKFDVLTPPAGMARPWSHDWCAPSGGFIDPLKEAMALKVLIENRLITRQDAIAAISDGRDFDGTIKQIKRERDAMAGLDPEPTGKPADISA